MSTSDCGRYRDGADEHGRCQARSGQQQVLALERLGWSLRRSEGATGFRGRETANDYLKEAGLTVRGRSRPPARPAKTGYFRRRCPRTLFAAGTSTG